MNQDSQDKWSNYRSELIFSDFCINADFNVDIPALIQECRTSQNLQLSKNRSNVGGWQSQVYTNTSKKNLNHLQQMVLEFSLGAIQKEGFEVTRNRSAWWININNNESYNVIHTHGRADVIGIFYLQVPKNAGELEILRNDGMTYTSLRTNRNARLSSLYSVNPEVSKFYMFPGHVWHHVKQSYMTEDRISISYNIEFQ